MGSHIFSNFRSSSHYQSQIIQVLMTACNHSVSLRGTCSSIMILFMFRNNPTKGQTGSGIYTSDGVTFKNILVTFFHFSIQNELGRFLEKMNWWKVTMKRIQHISFPSMTFLPNMSDQVLRSFLNPTFNSTRLLTAKVPVAPVRFTPAISYLSILKKKVQAERQKRTENGKRTVLFHWDLL